MVSNNKTRYNKGWDNLRPAKKGEVRNPNGRPKKERTLINIAEAMLKEKAPGQDVSMAQVLVTQWLVNCIKGNAPLFKELLDRLYGKAPEHITLEGGENPIKIIEVVKSRANDEDASV